MKTVALPESVEPLRMLPVVFRFAAAVCLVMLLVGRSSLLGQAAVPQQSRETPTDIAALTAKIAELEAKVGYLSDRQQISELFLRFFRGVNRHDVELMKSAFWPDAQVYYGYKSRGPRDEFVKEIIEGHEKRALTGHQHHVTNQTLDIDGDVAHVESYVLVFWRNNDDKSTTIGGGRYINRIDRRNGEWRIAVHEFIPTYWIEGNSIFDSSFQEPGWPRSGCGIGTWDKSDPSYVRPLNPRKAADGPPCAK